MKKRECTKYRSVKLSLVKLDGGTQTRVSINTDIVEEYAEAMRKGEDFPPVVLYCDGTNYWCSDGFHRINAAISNGAKAIQAEIRNGDWHAALKNALSANATNGLRRTNADKRNCVLMALENWPNSSSRQIADWCGVGHDMVQDARALADSANARITTRDGRTYPARRTPNQAQAIASESIPEAYTPPPTWEYASEQVATDAIRRFLNCAESRTKEVNQISNLTMRINGNKPKQFCLHCGHQVNQAA